MNRLLILDGNAVLHRAYHALPPLTSPEGKPTGAVYGFVSMMIKLQTDFHPTHVAVAFDRPAPTFRKELYKEYQSQRPAMEEALVSQIETVHEVVRAMGVSVFEIDGFEADDVIGTIVHTFKIEKPPKEAGKSKGKITDNDSKKNSHRIDQIIIVTGDRDILQLVSDESVLVYMPVKGLSVAKVYGEKEVQERLGVPPSLIVDWKALAGDSSDNYPGVSGIGPKTAADLVTAYQSIENLYASLEEAKLSEKIKEKLRTDRDNAFLSKTLATIRNDAPIEVTEERLKISTFDTPKVRVLLGNLGFHSLQKRLVSKEIPEKPQTENPKRKKDIINSDSAQLTLV